MCQAFISPRHDVTPGDLPQFPHLRVAAPTTEYMLAMKCMASRIPARPDERGDAADISFLIQRLGLTTPDEAMAIVARYYPDEQVPTRARFLLEEIFSQGGLA